MCEPGSREYIARVKRIAGILGVPSRSTLDEDHVDVVALEHSEVELPVVEKGGMPAQNEQRKHGTARGNQQFVRSVGDCATSPSYDGRYRCPRQFWQVHRPSAPCLALPPSDTS
jgi:hypothetical protein